MIYELNGNPHDRRRSTEQEPGDEPADHESVPLADHPLTAQRLAQHVDRLAETAYPYRFRALGDGRASSTSVTASSIPGRRPRTRSRWRAGSCCCARSAS